jgi:hypothetical protein
MERIPTHCIEIFKTKFGSYPCIIHKDTKYDKNVIEKKLSKHHLTWFSYDEITELLYEINGVYTMVYYNEKNGIFVLTTALRKESAENIIFDLNR